MLHNCCIASRQWHLCTKLPELMTERMRDYIKEDGKTKPSPPFLSPPHTSVGANTIAVVYTRNKSGQQRVEEWKKCKNVLKARPKIKSSLTWTLSYVDLPHRGKRTQGTQTPIISSQVIVMELSDAAETHRHRHRHCFCKQPNRLKSRETTVVQPENKDPSNHPSMLLLHRLTGLYPQWILGLQWSLDVSCMLVRPFFLVPRVYGCSSGPGPSTAAAHPGRSSPA